jgi:hypothetical protein
MPNRVLMRNKRRFAEKFVYGVGSTVEDRNTAGMDGILEEFHTCPACASAASRVRF